MFWNILKNDIVRGMFKRKYLYIIAKIVIVVLVIVADLSLRRKIGTKDIVAVCQQEICFRCSTGAVE